MDAGFATTVTLRSRVRVPHAERGKPLVIALHGWGMSPRTFHRWLQPGIDHRPGLSWWIPSGILPCEPRHRRIGYAWYVFDGDQHALRTSMDESRAYLASLVDLARRSLAPSSISLFGFSQGAYLASYVSLSRPDLFDGCICCCGRPKAEFVDDLGLARSVRMMVQTGARDESVTAELISKGVAPLKQGGLDVTEKSYDAEHRVIPEMAIDAAEFVDQKTATEELS